jgi:hypothetical protein
MGNARHKRHSAFVFAGMVSLFFLGYVLIIGISSNGFESIWWWLALLVVLLAIGASVALARRLYS